jgi:hypothetical protein
MKTFTFTPENLIDNIDKLGRWSAYGLAVDALQHYFPDDYEDEDNAPDVEQEVKLLDKSGCQYWHDLVVKYHKEVGYKGPFNPDAVNEF